MVYFSTPKTPGWSATVDGEEVDIYSANTAFMAVKVDAGEHDIELKFVSPGLIEGLTTSAAGIAAFFAILLCWQIRKRKLKVKK